MATLIWFLLIFSVVVISHEFGHYIIARASGIHVMEFYVGFGPTLFHFDKGGTRYSLKLLPLGGACVFEGQDGMIEGEEQGEGSFLKASVWSRFATVLAGPFFNVLLGFLLAFIMVNFMAIRDPVATEVLPGGAAEEAGLKAGDRILALNGTRICLYEDITLFNVLNEGKTALVTYERDGVTAQTTLTPKYSAEYGRYMLGISNADFIELKGADYFRYTWYEVRYNLKATYGSLGMLFRGKVSRQDVAGPVGIAVNVVGETYEQTREYGMSTVVLNMLNIALMLTINLGILNLLPIPALDGGRLIFILLEILRGRPVPPEKEAMVHFVGMMFFMVLVVVVFFNDLRNVFGF
ncbi:MAG: site-2 protease family protein [Lachnospiraceae bacterium]|nr:site-2 protease family protein [Lachnospiraceae bacterium]